MIKKPQLFLISTIVLLSVLLSACAGSASVASSWPGVTADQDSAYIAYQQHVYAVNLSNGQEKWRYPAKADNKINFFAAPTLTSDGQLLAGGFNNVLYSLNPGNNGSENWTFTGAKDRFIGSPLASDQGIFAPNADGDLYAIDSSGKLRWSFKTEGAQWTRPEKDPACNCVYVPSMDHHLYSVDAQTGKEQWKTEDLGGSIGGTPAFADGTLYLGTFKSEMLAIDAQNGKIRWRVPTKGWVWSGPTVKDKTLYFGDLSGTFYALDTSNGKQIWTPLQPDGPITEPALVTDDTIYFNTENGTLYALDLKGAEKWKQAIGGKLYTSPVLAGDTVLVAPVGAEALLYALDKNSGTQKWKYTPAK